MTWVAYKKSDTSFLCFFIHCKQRKHGISVSIGCPRREEFKAAWAKYGHMFKKGEDRSSVTTKADYVLEMPKDLLAAVKQPRNLLIWKTISTGNGGGLFSAIVVFKHKSI